MSRFLIPHSAAREAGFSLVELLVAAMVMLISSMGGTYLFNQATHQANAISRRLQQQFAVSNDLATILDLNDRYSCADLPTEDCSPRAEPPDQNQYVPNTFNAELNDPNLSKPNFSQLCERGLANDLVKEIQEETLPPGVARHTAILDSVDANGKSVPPHRYRVSWSADGRVLRQVQLVPTVAAWCP